jgi:solute carrier family 45 protein 1/2/4
MASRVVGVGNIIAFFAGYMNLPKYVWFFGNTQFKVLCVMASIALFGTLTLSIGTIRERNASLEAPAAKGTGLIALMKQIFNSIKRLPPQTRLVCEVQFFAWIGFFPQLFYSSSFVGDVYVQQFLEKDPHMTPYEIEILYEKATRVGTFALLIYAITSLTTNVMVPFFINPTYDAASRALEDSGKGYTTTLSRFLDRLIIPWLTVRKAWLISHIIFSGCMFSAPLVRSVPAATTLIGIIGISWAMTLWAPFAIISAEVSKRDAVRRSRGLDGGEADDQAGLFSHFTYRSSINISQASFWDYIIWLLPRLRSSQLSGLA